MASPESPASLVFTNDVILDTLYEYVSLGSWVLLATTSKDVSKAHTRMLARNWPELQAREASTSPKK